MNFLNENILTTLVVLPMIFAVLMQVIPNLTDKAAKVVGIAGAVVVFLVSVQAYLLFDGSNPNPQLLVQKEWLPILGVGFHLGIDGISLYLVLLTTFLIPLIFLSMWLAVEEKAKQYISFMFFLEATILGAFLALDLFLFYVFWEMMLVPMFFLIGIWGGKDRIYATQKFLLYTFVGSVPMLVAIIFLMWQSKLQLGETSALLANLMKLHIQGGSIFSPQGLVFLAFCLAFAIKVPLFPLHTWLPDAHVQAPTGGSVILAGVLLKLGGYGLLRFAMPLAPQVLPIFAPILMTIAAIAIVYGACLAIAQEDIKKLVAYSSVSHMGYVVLGIFSLNEIGITGGIYQMLNHGISTGALFFLVGILYERCHTREIMAYRGLAKTVPLFSIILIIVTFSSIALPGTNGFIGEFLILQGSFLASPFLTAISGTGVILGATYMLWLCQRILFGAQPEKPIPHLSDINLREFVYMLPLLVLILFMGIYPKPILRKMEPSIRQFSSTILINAAEKVTILQGNETHARNN